MDGYQFTSLAFNIPFFVHKTVLILSLLKYNSRYQSNKSIIKVGKATYISTNTLQVYNRLKFDSLIFKSCKIAHYQASRPSIRITIEIVM